MTQQAPRLLFDRFLRSVQTHAGYQLGLWISGLVLIVLSLTVGKLIEGQLAATGMPELSDGDLYGVEVIPLFFAFAFPLGLSLCAAAAIHSHPGGTFGRIAVIAIGVLTVSAPVLVPFLLGRELISYHFGVGGFAITLAALSCFWLLGRLRSLVPGPMISVVDLTIVGLLCFAAAAWNLCGSAAMPSFLLMPERLMELDSLPFAIGQMKSVLALTLLGWLLLVAAAALAVARLKGFAKAA